MEAVKATKPQAFIVENVPEFSEWRPPGMTASVVGPSKKDKVKAMALAGRWCTDEPTVEFSVRKRQGSWCVIREFERGTLYRHWLTTFRLAGYRIHETEKVRGGGQILNAAKFGVPQRRRRLIIVGHLEREMKIDSPSVDPSDEPTLASVLEFDAGSWSKISAMARPAARARVQHAHDLFGGGPCWGQHVSHRGAWGRSIDTPANTVTTRNQHWVTRGGEYRLWTVRETLGAMGFRPDYLDGVPRTKALRMAGNAVPPGLARGVLEQVAETLTE